MLCHPQTYSNHCQLKWYSQHHLRIIIWTRGGLSSLSLEGLQMLQAGYENWLHRYLQIEIAHTSNFQSIEYLSRPSSSNFLLRRSTWGTVMVSNALEMSKNTTQISKPWSRAGSQSSTTLISADHHSRALWHQAPLSTGNYTAKTVRHMHFIPVTWGSYFLLSNHAVIYMNFGHTDLGMKIIHFRIICPWNVMHTIL